MGVLSQLFLSRRTLRRRSSQLDGRDVRAEGVDGVADLLDRFGARRGPSRRRGCCRRRSRAMSALAGDAGRPEVAGAGRRGWQASARLSSVWARPSTSSGTRAPAEEAWPPGRAGPAEGPPEEPAQGPSEGIVPTAPRRKRSPRSIPNTTAASTALQADQKLARHRQGRPGPGCRRRRRAGGPGGARGTVSPAPGDGRPSRPHGRRPRRCASRRRSASSARQTAARAEVVGAHGGASGRRCRP